MKFNKKEFLSSELGVKLVECITTLDRSLAELSKYEYKCGPEYARLRSGADKCLAQWEVYRAVLQHFYGIEYYFTREEDHFGVCTEDESNWLFNIER